MARYRLTDLDKVQLYTVRHGVIVVTALLANGQRIFIPDTMTAGESIRLMAEIEEMGSLNLRRWVDQHEFYVYPQEERLNG